MPFACGVVSVALGSAIIGDDRKTHPAVYIKIQWRTSNYGILQHTEVTFRSRCYIAWSMVALHRVCKTTLYFFILLDFELRKLKKQQTKNN